MVSLHPATRNRLVKLLGMLGSDYDGERAAAGLKATALLRDCGLTWTDVLVGAPGLERRVRTGGNSSASHVPGVLWALSHNGPLTEWERALLRGIVRRPFITPRQQTSLSEILARLAGEAAGQRETAR